MNIGKVKTQRPVYQDLIENPKKEWRKTMEDIVLAYGTKMPEKDRREIMDRLYAKKRLIENQLYAE